MRVVVVLLCVVFACGCAERGPKQAPASAPITPAEAPLAVGDSICVTVHSPRGEQTFPCVIDSQGNIPLGLMGRVHVAGFTPPQAAKEIERRYRNMCIADWPNLLPVHVEVSR